MIVLPDSEVTLGSFPDAELFAELRRRPQLRRALLAELTQAELAGEAARKGRLLLEQPSTYCDCASCEGRHLETQ